ncbi:NAD(P)-dependent oxidoreductase [Chryseobacterium carnipullorum]|uniref:NAD(P)-dependent oxidoreductase n=1 Tax=Chryseobacterium carnipullorum TaxID=1124835 RepID=A0A3G6NII2_CHRCU|nr:NAD(P)-dependent oxidoreductase [Chryseobacterium carnipullorum]AZA64769.1 NAD(P)-dependent oxidoreductase [Chryseobacterium carnipullorum]
MHLFSQTTEAGVEKFFFVSTANTLGYENFAVPGNENIPQLYPFAYSFYAQSKLESENYLFAAKQRNKSNNCESCL